MFESIAGSHELKIPGFFKTHSVGLAKAFTFGPLILEFGIALYKNRETIQQKSIQAKQLFLHHFTPRQGETRNHSILRISRNVIGASLVATAIVVSVYAIVHFGLAQAAIAKGSIIISKIPLVQALSDKLKNDPWSWPIPESKTIVHTGYTAIGIVHAHRLLKDEEITLQDKIKFAAGAALSIATQAMFLSGRYETRWHHMSYGLLTMIPNFRALNLFGGLMAVDSVLYWTHPGRYKYDFSNVLVENFAPISIGIAAASALQLLHEAFQPAPSDELPDPGV